MYIVKLGDLTLLDAYKGIVLDDPTLELAANSAGSFTFTVYQNNHIYDRVPESLLTVPVTILRDGRIVWQGRIVSTEKGWNGELAVTCEGDLAMLGDSIQPPKERHNYSIISYLTELLEIHNAQCPDKAFELGAVTVKDSNDSLYRYTNYESTLQVIQTDLVDTLGGYLQMRWENDKRILDYLADSPRTCDQPIRFGDNLLDYVEGKSAYDIATVCIPLGSNLETSSIPALNERLTIAGVNDGSDRIEIPEAVAKYGSITKVVTWDDVHVASILKQKGEEWLRSAQYADMSLTLTAVDLADFGISDHEFRLLDTVRCISKPHGMDVKLPLLSMQIHLLDPGSNTYTIGTERKDFTGSSKKAQVETAQKFEIIPSENRILEQARTNATNLLNMSGKGGHVVLLPNAACPEEIAIIDTVDIETATKIWKFNANGLGYSNDGGQTYTSAWTMDGVWNGELIAAHTIHAEHLDVEYTHTIENQISEARDQAIDGAKEWVSGELEDKYWTKETITTKLETTNDSITQQISDLREKEIVPGLQVLEDNISQIKTDVDGVNITVSKVQTAVDNLEVGTRNLILNSHFDQGWEKWKISSSYCTATRHQDDQLGNTANLKFSSTTNGYLVQRFRAGISELVDGQQYTLSFMAKHSGTASDVYSLNFSAPKNNTASIPFEVSNQWQRYVFSWTHGENGFKPFPNGLRIYGDTTPNFCITEIQLEKSSIPSQWTAAPEDISLELEDVRSEIDQKADSIRMSVIDSIRGGRNILLNSHFRNPSGFRKSWSVNSGILSSYDDPIYGKCIKVYASTTSCNFWQNMGQTVAKLTSGTTYSIRCMVKASKANAELKVDGIVYTLPATADTWYEIKATKTATTTQNYFDFYMQTASTYYYITEVKEELGEEVTVWTPAPEDGEPNSTTKAEVAFEITRDGIRLEGYTTINKNFAVDTEGTMSCTNAAIINAGIVNASVNNATITDGSIGGLEICDGYLFYDATSYENALTRSDYISSIAPCNTLLSEHTMCYIGDGGFSAASNFMIGGKRSKKVTAINYTADGISCYDPYGTCVSWMIFTSSSLTSNNYRYIDIGNEESSALAIGDNVIIYVPFTCYASKSRVVETPDYEDRLLYSYETPTPMFGDIGEGTISDDGLCYVQLDPIFAETINTSQYQVFIQKYGTGDCYIKERSAGYFIVAGTPGMSFGWELKAKQRDYEQKRLDRMDGFEYQPKQSIGEEAAKYIQELKEGRIG